jgi:hypothetical protein
MEWADGTGSRAVTARPDPTPNFGAPRMMGDHRDVWGVLPTLKTSC